jgi:hypothetical protein
MSQIVIEGYDSREIMANAKAPPKTVDYFDFPIEDKN